jgi:hypothetical protein
VLPGAARQGRYACGSAWYTYGTGRAGASLPYGGLTVSLAWLSPSPRSVPVPGAFRPPSPRPHPRLRPRQTIACVAGDVSAVAAGQPGRATGQPFQTAPNPSGYGLQLIPSVRALVHVHGSLARWAVAACPDCALTIPRLPDPPYTLSSPPLCWVGVRCP